MTDPKINQTNAQNSDMQSSTSNSDNIQRELHKKEKNSKENVPVEKRKKFDLGFSAFLSKQNKLSGTRKPTPEEERKYKRERIARNLIAIAVVTICGPVLAVLSPVIVFALALVIVAIEIKDIYDDLIL